MKEIKAVARYQLYSMIKIYFRNYDVLLGTYWKNVSYSFMVATLVFQLIEYAKYKFRAKSF